MGKERTGREGSFRASQLHQTEAQPYNLLKKNFFFLIIPG